MRGSCLELGHKILQEHMEVKKGLGSCQMVVMGRQMQSWCHHFHTAQWELLLEPAVTQSSG